MSTLTHENDLGFEKGCDAEVATGPKLYKVLPWCKKHNNTMIGRAIVVQATDTYSVT